MYTTTNDIKKYLGIGWDATLDSFVDDTINTAQDFVERYCGGESFEKRWFDDTDSVVTRKYNGNAKRILFIDDLRSLTTLTIDNIEYEEGKDVILYPLNDTPKTQIQMNRNTYSNVNSRVRGGNLSSVIFPQGQANVIVEGKFGYSTTVPEAIKMATTRIASSIIKENIGDSDLKSVSKEELGEYSVSFESAKNAANKIDALDTLNQYRRNDVLSSVGLRKV
jgi:hypothetical protein